MLFIDIDPALLLELHECPCHDLSRKAQHLSQFIPGHGKFKMRIIVNLIGKEKQDARKAAGGLFVDELDITAEGPQVIFTDIRYDLVGKSSVLEDEVIECGQVDHADL